MRKKAQDPSELVPRSSSVVGRIPAACKCSPKPHCPYLYLAEIITVYVVVDAEGSPKNGMVSGKLWGVRHMTSGSDPEFRSMVTTVGPGLIPRRFGKSSSSPVHKKIYVLRGQICCDQRYLPEGTTTADMMGHHSTRMRRAGRGVCLPDTRPKISVQSEYPE